MLMLKGTKQEVIEISWMAQTPCPWNKDQYMRVLIKEQGKDKKPEQEHLRKARFGGLKGNICLVRKTNIIEIDEKRGYINERKVDVETASA